MVKLRIDRNTECVLNIEMDRLVSVEYLYISLPLNATAPAAHVATLAARQTYCGLVNPATRLTPFWVPMRRQKSTYA